LKERSDLPDSDGASSMKLSEDKFHEEERYCAEQQHEEVGNEERACIHHSIDALAPH